MRKLLTAVVAVAAIGATALTMSTPASAYWRGGWGWHGGWGWRGGWGWGPGPFIAGALAGAALAAPYYYAYGPYYPYGPYYGYGCRSVWNGYYWVRACYLNAWLSEATGVPRHHRVDAGSARRSNTKLPPK